MPQEYSEEQFPLSAADDHMIHQTPDPLRTVYSTDPRFFERHWNIFHDDAGEVLIATGGSFYPNLDTAEAYSIINVRGLQTSVRAFRRLGADRMDLHVGPIRPTITEGLRQWHHELASNDWGVRYSIDWRDITRQIYHAAYGSLRTNAPAGSQRQVTAGFESFGEVQGWVQMGDERIEMRAGRCRGTRDRHWGIGRGVGGPALSPGARSAKAGWLGGVWIRFRDFAIWGNQVLYGFGDARKGMGRVTHVERRMRFEEDTHIFLAGEIDFTLDDGSTKRVRLERIGQQTAYMRCGMYGGTPDKGLHHGMSGGVEAVEGDRFDLRLPETRLELRGLDEHHCRISCDGETATGILQPLEPDAYEACLRGEPGWSLLS
jgi:hypothetical protein